MAFWGVEVKPGKPHSHQFHNTQTRRLHISQATLGVGNSTTKSLVQCNVGDKDPVLLCRLIPEKSESCTLALEFEEKDDDVIFSVLGPTSVYLTGFYLDKPSTNFNNGTDSYGEAIGDPESNSCSGNDDDQVVIEEIPDDEKPAKVNGNHKRRIKKHQVSNSDGDVQKDIVKNDTRINIVEIGDNQVPDSERKFEDIEGCEIERRIVQQTNAPLVSLEIGPETDEAPKRNTVAVRRSARSTTVLCSYTEPKYDFNAFCKSSCEGSVKKRNVDVKSQRAKRKKKDVKSTTVLCSYTEPKYDFNAFCKSSCEGSVKKQNVDVKSKRAKRKKKDVKSSTYSLGVVYESVKIVDENAQGASRPKYKNICDDMEAGSAGPKSDEMPKKKKKRVKESQSGGVENNSKIDVQEKDNFIIEARIDDTFKNEPVKVPAIDNLSNDKAHVQSSRENDAKTKKKKKKQAKERQTSEVGHDNVIVVHKKENIQVDEPVGNDINQEVSVKDNAIDNISNDKCDVHQNESTLLPFGHENKKKENKKKKKHAKEGQAGGVGEESLTVVYKEVQSEVEARLNDVTMEECITVKEEKFDKQPNDMCVVRQGDSSLLPLEIAHDNKEKLKKCTKEGKTAGVGVDSLILVHKEVQSEIFEKKTDDVTLEEHITKEFEKQSNDMIVTIDANYVADEEITEKEQNEKSKGGSDTNTMPESGIAANAEDAKNSSVAEIEGNTSV